MKMAVADLDGTLLRSDKTISERTRAAIGRFRRKGGEFVLATARPPRFVLDYLQIDFDVLYSICYNGAEIYHGRELIFSRYIEAPDTAAIVRRLVSSRPGIKVSLEIENRLYANFDIGCMKGWVPPYTLVDFSSFVFRPAAKILVDMQGIPDIRRVAGMLPDGLSMIITDGGTLGQISHAESSKMNGIKRIAGMLGVDLADILAFGDDRNDIEMLSKCGLGMAMANATDEVKKAADMVTGSNDEDGVAAVLEEFLDD